MNKTLSCIFLTVLLFQLTGCKPSTEATSTPESVFDRSVVHAIDIQLSEQDWQAMMDQPTDEVYYEASIVYDGVTVTQVGFRTKGNSSLKSVAESDSNRYSFRIKLDKYVEDQTLDGYDEFVINNMFADASYMREFLSYEAMADIGLITPESAYVNVSINGTPYGLYLAVEAIDDHFIESHFDDDSGNLYKAEERSTLLPGTSNTFDQKKGEDTSLDDLNRLIEILNNMPLGEKGEIESVLDVESVLKYIASNAVLANFDSYNGNFSHNYYLYNESGIFTILPWDLNMSIGGFGSASIEGFDIFEPVSGIALESAPLIKNLLAVEAYKTLYEGYVKELVANLSNFENRVATTDALISKYVEDDPTKFVTFEAYKSSIVYDPDYVLPVNTMQNFGGKERGAMPQGGPMPQREPMKPEGKRGGMALNNVPIINVIKSRIEALK